MNPKTLFDNHRGYVHVSNYYSLVEKHPPYLWWKKLKDITYPIRIMWLLVGGFIQPTRYLSPPSITHSLNLGFHKPNKNLCDHVVLFFAIVVCSFVFLFYFVPLYGPTSS